MDDPGLLQVPDEFPYYEDPDRPDPGVPSRCKRCGSCQTTSYTRLMVASNPGGAISGDLIFHPVEVVLCMMCNKTSYRNYQTMRES